jgi:hypothetical protein
MEDKFLIQDQAEMAALVSYAFGSAVTDGAILGLLEKLCGLDGPDDDDTTDEHEVNTEQPTTTWCAPHRWSLTCRFALHRLTLWPEGQVVQHRSIKPPPPWWVPVINDLHNVFADVVAYYDDQRSYTELRIYAIRHRVTDPSTNAALVARMMDAPSPTRFNAYADLFLAIHHNKPIFEKIFTTEATSNVPSAVAALFNERTVQIGAASVTYTPSDELDKLMPIVRNLLWISKIAEANNTDPCSFQWRLSRFVYDIRPTDESGVGAGRKLVWRDDAGNKHEAPIAQCLLGSKLAAVALQNLRRAIGYYFDCQLEQDWATLLCILLHPTSSGCPVDAGSFKPWPCLRGRFEDVFRRAGSEWVQRDAGQMMRAVMRNGEKALQQELELQYDLDSGSAATSSAFVSEQAAATTGPAPKKSQIIPELCFGEDAGEADAEDDVPMAAVSLKDEVVARAMTWWLNRPPDKPTGEGDQLLSMVAFWSKQSSSAERGAVGLLKRVAARAGALVISQSAAERITKIPTEVWTAERRSMSADSIARDVFVYGNMDKYPGLKFEWT